MMLVDPIIMIDEKIRPYVDKCTCGRKVIVEETMRTISENGFKADMSYVCYCGITSTTYLFFPNNPPGTFRIANNERLES